MYTGGEVRAISYQLWLSQNTVKYGIDKKDLFRYNFVAVLTEMKIFFEKQLPIARNSRFRAMLEFHAKILNYFISNLEGQDFDPPKVVKFLQHFMSMVDLWSLHKSNPSEELNKILVRFRDNYDYFKQEVLVVVPIEAEQMGLDMKTKFDPPNPLKSLWKLFTPPDLEGIDIVLHKMDEDKVIDLRSFIH
ncbi:hypothetical protein AAEX28_14755 [Lentisphaerota bacterium WC36G]|nr:hypothetical protein LJT99_01510 [Lentisphaerae bacterium WC36]